jgi:hypothetical protein
LIRALVLAAAAPASAVVSHHPAPPLRSLALPRLYCCAQSRPSQPCIASGRHPASGRARSSPAPRRRRPRPPALLCCTCATPWEEASVLSSLAGVTSSCSTLWMRFLAPVSLPLWFASFFRFPPWKITPPPSRLPLPWRTRHQYLHLARRHLIHLASHLSCPLPLLLLCPPRQYHQSPRHHPRVLQLKLSKILCSQSKLYRSPQVTYQVPRGMVSTHRQVPAPASRVPGGP